MVNFLQYARYAFRLDSQLTYVENVDAVTGGPSKQGERGVMEPVDQFDGDQNSAVEDPAGNQWWIATHHKEDVLAEEVLKRSLERKK